MHQQRRLLSWLRVAEEQVQGVERLRVQVLLRGGQLAQKRQVLLREEQQVRERQSRHRSLWQR